MPDEQPAGDGAPGQPEDGTPEPERRDDGLDLARAMTRASAGSTPAKRARSRSRSWTPRTTGGRGAGKGFGSAFGGGAHPDDRDPQLLDTTVSRVVEDRGWDLDLRVQGVFGRWSELVGSEIGAHSTPESLAEGRLVVRTDSTAWATQLRLLAPTVVRRLNEELGHGTVTVIDVQGPHGPSWTKGRRSVRDGRGPRDTYG